MHCYFLSEDPHKIWTHFLELNPFLKTLDPNQLVSFRGHLIKINTVFYTLIENTGFS